MFIIFSLLHIVAEKSHRPNITFYKELDSLFHSCGFPNKSLQKKLQGLQHKHKQITKTGGVPELHLNTLLFLFGFVC